MKGGNYSKEETICGNTVGKGRGSVTTTMTGPFLVKRIVVDSVVLSNKVKAPFSHHATRQSVLFRIKDDLSTDSQVSGQKVEKNNLQNFFI